MARIYPSISDDFHSSLGEYKIFKELQKLNDNWIILYSLNWNNRTPNGNIQWGEADFVVLNKEYGMLVIEVKSGGIEFKDGIWYQQRLDNMEINKMKNPFKQADKSKYRFISLLDGLLDSNKRCYIDNAVWFPSISNVDNINLPLDYNKDIVLTEEALDNPEKYLVRAFNYYNSKNQTNMSSEDLEKVLRALLPEFNLIPSSSNIIKENDYSFLQLTNDQKKVLDFISDQGNVSIQGGAGTGKTFIAVEIAKRLSAQGKVLFLCFNRYLYLHLKNNCSYPNVDYYNIHSFVNKNYGSNILTPGDLCDALKIIDFKEFRYEYIIIDEAQDYDNDVLELIIDKSNNDGIRCIIFYDNNQLLYSDKMPDSIINFDCKLVLNKNCRNTFKILNTTNSPLNLPIKIDELCVDGIMPKMYISSDANTIINSLNNTIQEYIELGYSTKDIVILTLKTENESILSDVDYIGEFQLSRDFSYDDSILFTTSKKYKGLESNVVLIVDFDSVIISSEENNRLFYVSASRARQRLDIFFYNYNNNIIDFNNYIPGNENVFLKISKKYKCRFIELDKKEG